MNELIQVRKLLNTKELTKFLKVYTTNSDLNVSGILLFLKWVHFPLIKDLLVLVLEQECMG